MNRHRKRKKSGPPAQGHLWNDRPSHRTAESKNGPSSKRPCVDDSAQRKLKLLSRKLAAMEKRLSQLQSKPQRLTTRNKNEVAALSNKLSILLPALFILERMKVVALKETKRAIKPLTPKGGIVISTSISAKKLGSEIGLSAKQSEKAVDFLMKAGCVRKKAVGIWELGKFALDKKGRVIPSYYLEISSSDQLMYLLDVIENA